MDQKSNSFFFQVIGSFRFAAKGWFFFFQKPSNAWVHLMATLFVCASGCYLGISRNEWIGIVLAVGLVFVAEMINSSIENLTDLVSPQYQELAGKVKDLAAGAVLMAALIAVIIAGLIFLPRIC